MSPILNGVVVVVSNAYWRASCLTVMLVGAGRRRPIVAPCLSGRLQLWCTHAALRTDHNSEQQGHQSRDLEQLRMTCKSSQIQDGEIATADMLP